jgi:hypothetical protein
LVQNQEDDCDPFALAAEHYRIAAENELPDDGNAGIYWWSYAANMARAKPQSGYTLKQLLQAIEMAEAADRVRDVGLWGENEQRGGTYESLAKITADYFQDQVPDAVLPQVKLVRRNNSPDSDTQVMIGEEIICSSFREFQLKDIEFTRARRTGTAD